MLTVSASQSFNAGRLAVVFAYAIGSAVVLYLLMLGGRSWPRRCRRGAGLQMAMGAVMVLVAFAMWQNYDVRFQNAIATGLPSFLISPAKASRRPHSGAQRPGRSPRRKPLTGSAGRR